MQQNIKSKDAVNILSNYLADDIKKVNDVIKDGLSVNEELINLIGKHLLSNGGKRIRPLLTILSAKVFNHQSMNVIYLAAAIELIHMATILHDDVVDGSKMRRFLPTAHTIWGGNAAILVGDFLFSKSFILMTKTDSLEALKILSDASARIIQGEVSQLAKLELRSMISEAEYLEIIKSKTSTLFGAACTVGCMVAGGSENDLRVMKSFGTCLGNIFQISDDLLDYYSDIEESGKNVGDDFFEGKVTLPIIFLYNKVTDDIKKEISRLISQKTRTKSELEYICDLLSKYEIRQDVKDYIINLRQDAVKLLDDIDISSGSREYLISLVDFAINRTY